MTSSTDKIQAANGGTSTSDRKPEHGLSVLRRVEAQGLIRIACDALSETSQIARRSTAASDGDPGAVPQAADLQRPAAGSPGLPGDRRSLPADARRA